jgi:glycosyltransferase involved in cell wall biosynthesis
MRIAYLLADYGVPVFGRKGASVHTRELINALAGLGHEVTVLAARRADSDGSLKAEVIEVRRLIHYLWAIIAILKMERLSALAVEQLSIRTSADILERLRRLHARKPFDCIYERYSLWSTAGVEAAEALHIPCLVELNSPLLFEEQRYRRLMLVSQAKVVETEVIQKANAIVSVSEEVKRYVLARGADPGRTFVIPNGVDSTRFHAAVEPESLDGADGKFVIGFVGSFEAWHGIEVLLQAFRRLAIGSGIYHLLLVGDGPLRRWVKEYIQRLGLGDRATLTGWVPHDQLPRLIKRMDVAVAPYPPLKYFYFSPLKLYEYLAVGRPVVASRLGQIQQVIKDQETGLLVRPGDPDELAENIERLRHDPQLRKSLGLAAAEQARHWTWEANARRVIALAEQLIWTNGHRIQGTPDVTRAVRSQGYRAAEQQPYLFVVGCPRSGTTLLQCMLDHHPWLAVALDTHFIPEAIKEAADGMDPPLTPELVERVRQYRHFPRLQLSDAAIRQAAVKARTYSEFVSALYEAYARKHGKPLAGEKTPDYCKHLPLLHRLFPWVKTVHTIRDGRDVALSTLEWARRNRGPGRFGLWQEQPLAVCALWWRWQVGTGRRDGVALGPSRYLEIRYDDVVDQSEDTLRRITAFLELSFADEMLTYSLGKISHKKGLTVKEAWLPPTPGIRTWRTQMAARDVELFEALAGDLLSELGYERRFERISPEVAATAERCQRWWDAEMARREATATAPSERSS